MDSPNSDQTEFLNIDLDVTDRAGVRKLLTAMGEGVSLMGMAPDEKFMSVELGYEQPKTPDHGLSCFIKWLQHSMTTLWCSGMGATQEF